MCRKSRKVLGVLSEGVTDRVGLLCPQGAECILCVPPDSHGPHSELMYQTAQITYFEGSPLG